jgi:hypothetical protein
MSLKKEVRGNDILADDKSVSLGTKGTAFGRIFLSSNLNALKFIRRGKKNGVSSGTWGSRGVIRCKRRISLKR